jgi:hypothetical protein
MNISVNNLHKGDDDDDDNSDDNISCILNIIVKRETSVSVYCSDMCFWFVPDDGRIKAEAQC